MKGKHAKITGSILIGLILALFIFGAMTALADPGAQAPTLISYQGFLTVSDGNPMTGTVTLQFDLYDSETGGTPLWTETQAGVTVSDGYFAVMLGSVTPLSASDFSGSERWLKVTVDGTAMPRQRFASVPYALQAENAATSASVPWSGITGIPAGFADGVDDVGTGGSAGWLLTGNSGTTNAILGTTDTQTLTMVVSNTTAMRFTPGIDDIGPNIPNIIGGYEQNSVADGVFGAVIGGGGGDDFGLSVPNRVTDSFATISGGKGHTAGGSFATISGGGYNTTGNPYATIGGGHGNYGLADYVFVGGGANNAISSQYGVIGGGSDNTITSTGSYATIAGGSYNTVNDHYATIGGGDSNVTDGKYAVIGGGRNNRAGNSTSTTDDYATVAGGSGNNAANAYSVVTGGLNNLANADNSFVGGGQSNQVNSSYGAISGGMSNLSKGQYGTIGGGYLNVISATNSTIPGGYQAQTTHYGEMAYASGAFTNAGDAQATTYVLRGVTLSGNGNTTELHLDGSSQQLTIANNRVVAFDAQIVAVDADGTNAASYHIVGSVKNISGSSIALVGTPQTTAFEDASNWNASVGVDNVNDALIINVTGDTANGHAVLWVATVRATEVAF